MDKNIPIKKRPGRFLRGLSIKQRLPLLICALLLCIIIGFSLASYYTVRKAAMEMGRERLRSLTTNLGSMLSQSTAAIVSAVKKNAANDTIRQYLVSGRKELNTEVIDVLKRLQTDSTIVLIELLDTNSIPVTSYSKANEALQNKLSTIRKTDFTSAQSNFDRIGKMYAINNSIYFPIIVMVNNNKQLAGYLVSWRLLTTSPQAIEQVSKLMGKGAVLYIRNKDGSLWTDMLKPVSHPPITIKDINDYLEYKDPKGHDVVASAQLINSSDWLVLIEFSKSVMLESATRFLKWIILIGGLLVAAGIFITWIMSYNITKPLDQLTKAAMAISKGDYSVSPQVNKNDELGKLAHAFTIMKDQVQTTQLTLENKVIERTAQLESVNSELEAFSYSVSHDLRAPLRGIMGFTTMLEDKYSNQLDEEAKRLTSVIKKKALAMGNLIDDLLGFSRISRQDIVKHNIPTNELVKEIIANTGATDQISWDIEPLPESWGDTNTIRQVWTNLISNAKKYTGNAVSPRIEIGSFTDKEKTVFFVKDNGVGFDPKYKDKLFKVFQRLHGAAEFEGTGVGLAVVEKIISKHGGKVWADAEKDKGASFYFSLPAGPIQST
jgi:signal transduction histidine kinase